MEVGRGEVGVDLVFPWSPHAIFSIGIGSTEHLVGFGSGRSARDVADSIIGSLRETLHGDVRLLVRGVREHLAEVPSAVEGRRQLDVVEPGRLVVLPGRKTGFELDRQPAVAAVVPRGDAHRHTVDLVLEPPEADVGRRTAAVDVETNTRPSRSGVRFDVNSRGPPVSYTHLTLPTILLV